MIDDRAAPRGAITSALRADADEVRWLKPRSAACLRKRPRRKARRSGRSFGRLTAALGVGAILTGSTFESAVAPAAAHAPLDLAGPETMSHAGEVILLASRGESRQAVEAAILADAPARTPIEVRVAPAAPLDPEIFTGATAPAVETPKVASVEAAAVVDANPPAAEMRHDEILRFGGVRIPRALVETIVRAADAAGVDPAYMMALADKESSFTPDIKAPTSSAQGLFQFIERTWLEVIRDFGPKYGMEFAAASVETVGGQPTVANEATREWVLGLRCNPFLSALMAAEMLKRDKGRIERRIGRALDRSELYLMHFLGAESAGKLLALVEAKPKQSAPKVFPAAAKANKALFFAQERKKKVRHLSVAEVYVKLDRMIDSRLNRYDGVTALTPSRASFALQ